MKNPLKLMTLMTALVLVSSVVFAQQTQVLTSNLGDGLTLNIVGPLTPNAEDPSGIKPPDELILAGKCCLQPQKDGFAHAMVQTINAMGINRVTYNQCNTEQFKADVKLIMKQKNFREFSFSSADIVPKALLCLGLINSL